MPRYCIVVTRQEGRDPVVYGTWRNPGAASERALSLNLYFEETRMDCAASVVEIWPQSASDDRSDVAIDCA